MNRTRLSLALAAVLLGPTAGCGGGGGGGGSLAASPPAPGGGGSGGIGGSGLTSSGTIDGTGSIFVNGIRFDVDDAEIVVDGERATEEELRLGMVVTVRGSVDDDGINGTAERVDYDEDLTGPVESLEVDADGNSLRLRVLGQVVLAERTGTVFEDTRFDTLTVGDVIEVSGFRDAEERLRATRIDREEDFVAGESRVAVEGVIVALDGLRFRLAGREIDAANATLEAVPGDALANGLRVEVEGILEGDLLIARRIEGIDDDDQFDVDETLRLQGAVTARGASDSFRVDGVSVDASGAGREPADLVVADGVVLEVIGRWDGEVLRAATLRGRRGRIKLEAAVSDLDGDAGTLTLSFSGGVVTLATDARTLFDDDRDDEPFLAFADLRSGDYVEAEAVRDGDRLLATRIDREDTENERVLQAPVEDAVDGVSITLLGIRFQTAGAAFENAVDDDLTADGFYANLIPGALVKVEDDDGDGVAEEVEFEFAAALDGEREFRDDDEERLPPDDPAVPAAILDYVAANFPAADIAAIWRDEDDYEVYLVNGIEITFDLEGNFLEADDDFDDGDADGGDEEDDSDADASDADDGEADGGEADGGEGDDDEGDDDEGDDDEADDDEADDDEADDAEADDGDLEDDGPDDDGSDDEGSEQDD